MSKVLVIDDDRVVRHLIQETFKDSDVRLAAAKNADEGLQELKSMAPDVVLLDQMLPSSSGLEVFEQIREFDAKLPVIFITSCNDSETAIEAIKGGAYDYLYKPLDVGQVRACVDAGGSVTGEHGIGLDKLDYMELIFSSATMDAMCQLRSVFDPARRANPGKVVPVRSCREWTMAPATRAR